MDQAMVERRHNPEDCLAAVKYHLAYMSSGKLDKAREFIGVNTQALHELPGLIESISQKIRLQYYIDILELVRLVCQQTEHCIYVLEPYALLYVLQSSLISSPGTEQLGVRNCAEVLRRSAIRLLIIHAAQPTNLRLVDLAQKNFNEACNIWNHDAEDIDDRSAFEIYAIRARLQNGRGKNDSARQNATKALQLLKQIQVEKAFVQLYNDFAAVMEDQVKRAAEVPTAAADDSFMKSIREEHEQQNRKNEEKRAKINEKRKAKQKNKKTKKVNKKAAQTSSTCNQDSDEEEEDVGSKLADSDDHTSTAHSDKENVRSKFVDNDHTSPASHHSHVAGEEELVAQQVELRISDAFNNNHHGNSDTESFVSTTTDVGQQNLSRLPSLASEKFLKDLLQDFVIRIGCQKCMNSKSSVTDASCEQNEEECSRDRLLAATNTSGNWHPVRCIVLDYLNDICLCQPQRQQCVGETCVHAHNSVELQIWRRARQACLALEEFFLDVTHSKLLPELILRFLTSRKLCELAMLCRECVRQENYDSALKAKHRPKCQGGHQWNDCAGLCYAINDARGQGKVAHFIGDRVAQPALSGKQELVAICINEVKRFGLTDEDILSLATTTEYHKPRDAESKRPRASSKWAVDSLEQFTGDTLDNESQSLSQLDESIDDNGDGDNDIYGMQDMEEEPYYKLIPAEEARKKTLGYSDKYRHCRVKLDGLQSASAVPVQGDSQIILLSGRSNCGPCFDGDEVIVKLKPNSDQHASKESSTSDPSTRRGTVVAIVKKVQRRKGSVFICTVDEHSSSLMRPLCGTVPKIHVMNGAARDKFGDERVNNYVALYKRGDNGHIQPTSVIALNEKKRQDKLFVVCIEKWDHNYMYPLGFAMCYIPEGTDEASSQRIINLACHVPARYQPGDLANFQPDLSTWAAQLQCHREDLRSEFIISIDPPECTDVDDALSVKVDKDNQKYTVSVHIADVSFFVAKDSKLDNEACRRGLTYYPVGKQKPIHMLPGEFVEHYCSLLPHRDRPCITVTFVVDQEGNVEEPHVSRTLISNKRKLTYSEAQELITSYADNKNFGKHIEGESSGVLRTTLMHLNLAAQLLRRKRLGNSRHHVLVDKLLNLATHQDTAAHILVEELMITANSIVAERIIKKFPHCTPLRRQSSPEKEELEKWFKQYAHYSSLVSSIEQHAPYHLDSAVSDEQIDEPKVSLLAEVAEMLREATQSEDIAKIREILRAEQYHPLQALALDGWLSIQHSAEYVSSGCCEDFSHFALNKQHYTHFTSPIRRYIDIIIHRLLVSTLESTEQCPYTNDDMREICSRANKTKSQEKKFEKYSTILATAASLSSAPVFMPGILVEIDESGLCFQFPGLPHMKRGQRSVTFSKLDVSEKPYHPVIGEDQTREFIYDMEQMILKWNRRIYDVNCFSKVESAKPQSDTNVLKLVEITSDRHVRNVSLQHYQSVRKALKNSNNSQLLEAVRLMLLAVEWNPTCPEILSETKSGKIVKHHTEGRLQLHAGVVMHVQLGAECQQGFLQPRIMQVSLTPEYCMCVQHMDDAVKCFSNVATKKLEDRYKSLSQYQDIWRPIISMEAAYSAIQETDPVVIKNVPVRLRRVSDTNRPKYCGQLELDIQFCMERCINLSYNVKDGDEDMLDYLCLKFALTPRRYDHTIVQANTWTCHALGDRNAASDLDDSSCTSCSAAGQHFSLKFVVHHSSTPPPSELLDHPGVTCTVELLAKPLPHRRMDEAIAMLPDSHQLCKSITLGEQFDVSMSPMVDIPKELNIKPKKSKKSLPANNASQTEAIRKALTQSFTLVQGPPGTGKTITAIKIAYWFAHLNSQASVSGEKKQVMYCGPSNSAVDVAMDFMLDYLGDRCPKILRVYSEVLERQVFPIPQDLKSERRSNSSRYALYGRDLRRDVALHHVIREPNREFSAEILSYDRRFEQKIKEARDLMKENKIPPKIDQDMVNRYQKLITKASEEAIREYDIILCTCSVSAGSRIKRAANIAQVIVDECAMCMEPEVLIPLVNFEPHQVVLVGDHCQLRPIILCRQARRLGMERSLFERWAELFESEQDDSQRAFVMLDKQYRMHPAICELPSQLFYGGRLRSADYSSAWTRGKKLYVWNDGNRPIVFCHVEGIEKSQMVSTAEGNEQSKSNDLERDHVTRIFRTLVNYYKVVHKTIAILSQYKAQCSNILKDLKQTGMEGIHVNTVVASQGAEWDYVILNTVRSLPRDEIEPRPTDGWLHRHLGFIIDHNQINVALTRAKKGLIIVGNKHLLRADAMWHQLLDAYEEHGCLVDAEDFPYVRATEAPIPRLQNLTGR